jgi:hypothetical protein
MKVKVTLTQIKTPNGNFTVAGDYFVEGDLEIDTTGTLVVVRDRRTKIAYITDFASASVNAVMTAAADTGGNFVLT